MKERPILFSTPMVQAILKGDKTQTRRKIKHVGPHDKMQWLIWDAATGAGGWGMQSGDEEWYKVPCPYGVPGDRLWVRETWAALHPGTDDVMREVDPQPPICSLAYRATDERSINGNWRPSIFMPRWASRITLEVVGVRVQRLQEISEDDAKAEGCTGGAFNAAFGEYMELWDHINGKREGCAWKNNPWVWAVTFRAVKA